MQLCTAMNLLWQTLGIDPTSLSSQLNPFSGEEILICLQPCRLLTQHLQLFLPGDELGYENPSGQQVLAVAMPLLRAEAPM